jgi:cyclophilin family peptidyl-prolyl cis-trans isomerase
VAQKLHDQYNFDYQYLKVLRGGWNGWMGAGYPTETGATPGAVMPAPSPTYDMPPGYLVVETSKGHFKIWLYNHPFDGVPAVARNFVEKAAAGYFNGKTFHRVEDWVVQGGDPQGDGTGGGSIPAEYNEKPFLRGAVGVASTGAGAAAINDSQWFVVKQDSAFLNGQYANIGAVIQGMDVVDRLEAGDKMIRVTATDDE